MSWFVARAECIPFLALMFANAWFTRRVARTWVNPGCIFSLFWIAMTGLPLCIAYHAPINPLTVAFIALSTVAFSASALAFDWAGALRRNAQKGGPEEVFGNGFITTVVFAASLVSAICTVLQVVSEGFSLAAMLGSTLQVASGFASNRYAGDTASTLISASSWLCAYVAVICGGLAYGASARRTRLKRLALLVASFLPSVAIMLLESSKGLLFLSMALFYGGVLTNRAYIQHYVLVAKSDLSKLLVAGMFLVPLVVLSFMARGLYDVANSGYVAFRLHRYFVSYSSGHLYAFSDWLSHYVGGYSLMYYNDPKQFPGFYSFLTLSGWLGETKLLPMGVYGEFYSYGTLIATNIYTVFRGSITDFGILGSFVVTFFVGLAAQLAFYRLLWSRRPWLSTVVFIFVIGGVYMSYLVTLFRGNVIPAAAVAVAIVLGVNRLFVVRARRA